MDPIRLARLRYRAWRRGFREADLLLGSFADARAAAFTPGELDDFEALLEEADHNVWAWATGAPAPKRFEGGLMAKLRAWRMAGVR